MTFPPVSVGVFRRVAAAGALAFALAACNYEFPKQLQPVPHALVAKMEKLGMKETSAILIRIFKEESTLELWKQKTDGQFALLESYNICKWSGVLGPKKVEGDRQAPEGFYVVTPAQMNPKSSYYLSFNIGYPNAYDKALGRSGSNLMVHGACSSAGCYSMTDEDAGVLFSLARDSFRGGQTSFQIQAYPFRMTPENMAKHRDNPNMVFWQMLKQGYDHFEVTRQTPKIDVCDKRYVFDADAGGAPFDASRACPTYTVPVAISTAVAAKEASDEKKFTQAIALLEEESRKATEAKAASEAKVAAKAVEAEAGARNNPSLVARLLGRGKKAEVTAAVAEPAALPDDFETGASSTSVASAIPSPRTRPEVKPAVVEADEPIPVAKPAPRVVKAKAEEPPPEPAVATEEEEPLPDPAVASEETAPKPLSTPESPPVGRFVKGKKFNWPDES